MKEKLIYAIIKIKLRDGVNKGMEKETIALERELAGKTIRESFFELKKEIDERFSEIQEKYLNSVIKLKNFLIMKKYIISGKVIILLWKKSIV